MLYSQKVGEVGKGARALLPLKALPSLCLDNVKTFAQTQNRFEGATAQCVCVCVGVCVIGGGGHKLKLRNH